MTVENCDLVQLENKKEFINRHIGSDAEDQKIMLSSIRASSIQQLITNTAPASILINEPIGVGDALSEQDALDRLKKISKQNKVYKSYIGLGYYDTHVPAVIARNVLENPGWYTAYTPYQAEISQGRLEALLNFQQMIIDLTGLDVANASLLDEATAAAEAMTLIHRSVSKQKKNDAYFVSDDVFPQTIDVIKTRASYLGINVVVGDPKTDINKQPIFGLQLQYPNIHGAIEDLETIINEAKQQGVLVSMAADPLALVLLKSPGELGADVAIGSTQRFGVPMGFGGPHAAYFATRKQYTRSIPGRIIGVSVDSRGRQALRMAMQTREQHIRRDKAASNICTAQALLANMASFYAVYHGREGLKRIAERVQRLASILARGLIDSGMKCQVSFFDTLTLEVNDQQEHIYLNALKSGCNLRRVNNDRISLSLDETTTRQDIIELFHIIVGRDKTLDVEALDNQPSSIGIAAHQRRKDEILTHPNFSLYHSEAAMVRYIKQLENKDYSLTHGMIPLGSCTMKLNATSQMIPISWPEFSNMHPFAPNEQTAGYELLLTQLQEDLSAITGFDHICLQPNSGAQGEYTGLLAIRNYQKANNEGHRNICLIPSSAHGTNPASAGMTGLKIVIVTCDQNGNVDVDDLRKKAQLHSENLSALMITYPSTHGVFESEICTICEIIHQHGGQVYMDGANMNALVGIAKPGKFGADVSHLNLHKTFAIPHGGGGPGMGPIGIKSHLKPYLPSHKVSPVQGINPENGAVSAAPFGSASILPITWMYIKLLGDTGLKTSSQAAILHANYIAEKLSKHYDILYKGQNNRVAHECIIDIRPLKSLSGITEEDIAKRLMDYGFHAPTMSFPVPGTLMIEPTESEPKVEIDRFIEALISIRHEIEKVQTNYWSKDENPLVYAPHTVCDLLDEWTRPYSLEEAVYPTISTKKNKFWPTINRVNNTYGDRNFVCSCPPISSYE